VSPENYNDDDLVKAMRLGDKRAFEIIFEKYWFKLFSVAYSRLKSREEAEEIVQDIFTSVWKNHDTLLISNLSFYLFASVRKRTVNTLRSRLTHQKYWDYYSRFFKDYSESTQEDLQLAELNNEIEKAILKLPKKSQAVVRLNRIQGLSVAEIAESLNIPKRTIEHYLTKSIRELRIHLKDYILLALYTTFLY